jgi:hypothetical protein
MCVGFGLTIALTSKQRLPENDRQELATTLDGEYVTTQGAVSHDFWVSIFSMHDVLLLHILFCSYISDCLKRATTRSTHLQSLTVLLTRS